jgi:hypothetical protein
MAKPKTLVIGSTKHEHVTSVSWDDAQTQNIVDFDVIVVNCRALTADFLAKRPWNFFIPIRRALVRLLDSEGSVIVVGSKLERGHTASGTATTDSYSWSPIVIGHREESGDTIEIVSGQSHIFPSYFARFTRWEYWYYVPESCLTLELSEFFGSPSKDRYAIAIEPIAVNRYGRALAGVLKTKIQKSKRSVEEDGDYFKLGGITLLPEIRDLEPREAVNLILEDLLELPQKVLPPEWTASISVPGVKAIEAEVLELRKTIDDVEGQIDNLEQEKAELEFYKQLLFASGTQLESVRPLPGGPGRQSDGSKVFSGRVRIGI